jgi:hypothetical protein
VAFVNVEGGVASMNSNGCVSGGASGYCRKTPSAVPPSWLIHALIRTSRWHARTIGNSTDAEGAGRFRQPRRTTALSLADPRRHENHDDPGRSVLHDWT